MRESFQADLTRLASDYDLLLEKTKRLEGLLNQGRRELAIPFFEEEIEAFFEGTFLRQIERIIDRETASIMNSYDPILLKTRSLNWSAEKTVKEIQAARLSIRYFLSVARLSNDFFMLLNKLGGIVRDESDREMEHFTQYRHRVRSAIGEIEEIIGEQRAMAREGESEDAEAVEKLRGAYEELSSGFSAVFAAREGKNAKAVIAVLDAKVEPFTHNILIPAIYNLLSDSIGEIKMENSLMLERLISREVLIATFTVFIALSLIFLTYRLAQAIVRSTELLKKGTEMIGAGNLEYVITIRTKDEFGDLASAINNMARSLKQGSDELKGFVYSVSHDLRAPLVNVRGFTGELRRSLDEILSAAARRPSLRKELEEAGLEETLRKEIFDALEFIDSSAGQIERLINALLKFAHAGHRDLYPETLDSGLVVRDLLKSHAREIEKRQVTITVGDLPDIVADWVSLEQIMGHLIDNAIKYLLPGRPGEVRISSGEDERNFLFHVTDNGRGISEDDIPKAFAFFRRVGTQEVPGEGMGLAYVRTLVTRHGGTVSCTSDPGVGTTFTFTIPKGIKPSPPLHPAISPPHRRTAAGRARDACLTPQNP